MLSLAHLLPRPPLIWQVCVLPRDSVALPLAWEFATDLGGTCHAKEAIQISCRS